MAEQVPSSEDLTIARVRRPESPGQIAGSPRKRWAALALAALSLTGVACSPNKAVASLDALFTPPSGDYQTSAGPINPDPTGPPTPDSGWHVDFADSFNAPLGTAPGEDNFWYPSQPWNPDLQKTAIGNNPYETEVYDTSQVAVRKGNLVLSAKYQENVAATAAGSVIANHVQRNYVSGLVATPTNIPDYKGFTWTPGGGSTWAFEIDCQFPVETNNDRFNAWWTSTQDGWHDERDFFEGHAKNDIDTDWIYAPGEVSSSPQDYYENSLSFDPAAAMHRYTYVINPNQSWSLYVDGQLQTWVGDDGVAPERSSSNTPMELIVNYALDETDFNSGTRNFLINSIAVYQDAAHVGQSTAGGGLAPGTTIARR